MIFFTIPRAFEGEFDTLQQEAIASWKPWAEQIVLFGNAKGIAEVAKQMDCVHVSSLECNAHGTPLLRSAFEQMEHHYGLLCEISADILLNMTRAYEPIQTIERPFVIGQRYDFDPRTGEKKLHPPSGVDYFIYRRGTLGQIPAFAVGLTLYDNWLVWAAIKCWKLQVIDATEAIDAVHINHGYPDWREGKAGMFASEGRAENHRLFFETGAPRPFGIKDAPWVMNKEGRVVQR